MGRRAARTVGWRSIAALVVLGGLVAGSAVSQATGEGEVEPLLTTARRAISEERYEDAEAALRRAVERDPESAVVRALLGRVLALQDEYLEAEEELERAVALGADDVTTLVYLGSARWENGRLRAAEEALRRATEATAGGSPLAARQLGRFLLWQGRYQEAVEPLRVAVRALPDATDVLYDLAQALAGAERTLEAVELYRHVLDQAPDHTRAHYGFGLALSALGRDEEAERHLETYERLYRQDQAETRRRGRLEAEIAAAREETRRGDWQAAVARLSALPETPETQLALARVYRGAGDLDRAIAVLEQAVAAAPARRDLRLLLRELRIARREGEAGGGEGR